MTMLAPAFLRTIGGVRKTRRAQKNITTEGEDGYEYGDDGDDGGYDEEYPAPQDARSAGGGVTFDQPYESAGSTSFRRRSRNHLSKGKHKANSEPSLFGMMSCVPLTTISSSFLHHRSIQSL